ncbi:MAG: fibronectin type III domain-containing protein [candidate division WOR-3 bacterium]
MKNKYVYFFLPVIFALVFFWGCGVIGGPPSNLQITSAGDSTSVQLTWTTPPQGVPDSFLIYFCPANDSVFSVVGDTTGNTYIHNPQGLTGSYQVSAIFAGKEYKCPNILATIPIHTPPKVVYELDGVGDAGYGWHRDQDTGTGQVYSMRQKGNADKVDFYITDFSTGSNLPYLIASPDMGPSEPSGVVDSAGWRRTGFTNPLNDENAPLPTINETIYFNFTEIPNTLPALIGCFTVGDNHYGLIKVLGVNTQNATVEVESWFQLIPNLRLIHH